jgi:negative regulator of sigma E activity
MNPASAVAMLLAAATLSSAAAKESRDPLLFAAIAAPANVSYTGVVQVVRIGSRSAEADVYRIEHRAPDLTRRVYTAPAALAGDTMISKGDLLYSLDTSHRRVVETRNDAVHDPRVVDAEYTLLSENYQIVRKGDDSVDGRHTLDIALVSKHTHRMTVLVRIDAASKIALDREEFGANGALLSETRFEEVAYPAQLSTSDFSLPKGYPVVRDPAFAEMPEPPGQLVSRAGFAPRMPRWVADGFAPVEGDFVAMQGVRSLQILYSDGIRTFSLFESSASSRLQTTQLQTHSMTVAGRDAQYAEDGATALLAWSDASLHYTLVGEVGAIDLPQIAAAIERQ